MCPFDYIFDFNQKNLVVFPLDYIVFAVSGKIEIL